MGDIMEKYVCSLKLAKRLKELGVKQESEFYWIRYFDSTKFKLLSRYELNSAIEEEYSAFTVGELGEMLPIGINTIKRNVNGVEIDYQCFGCVLMYNKMDDRIDTIKVEAQYADTEANARAKMRIYLLKNKLIKVE